MQKIGHVGIKVNILRLSNLFLEIMELCSRGAKFAVDLETTFTFNKTLNIYQFQLSVRAQDSGVWWLRDQQLDHCLYYHQRARRLRHRVLCMYRMTVSFTSAYLKPDYDVHR